MSASLSRQIKNREKAESFFDIINNSSRWLYYYADEEVECSKRKSENTITKFTKLCIRKPYLMMKNNIKMKKEFTRKHFDQIKHLFPERHTTTIYCDYQVLKAMFYVFENGCTWSQLPKKYGKGPALRSRIQRWHKAGIVTKLFEYFYCNNITTLDMDEILKIAE